MDTYPQDSDGDALRRVADMGADMSKPMPIDFHIAIPNENAGIAIAARAEKLGYSTKIWRDSDDGEWTCDCTKIMLATYEGVISSQSELDELAAPIGGVADGWGTFGNEGS
jgi:regulator of RNase E activity RraB